MRCETIVYALNYLAGMVESSLLKKGSTAVVTLVQGDAAIGGDMADSALADELGQPPVIGLVHAGGLLADATLLKQRASGVQAVFAPKARPCRAGRRCTCGAEDGSPWDRSILMRAAE